MNKSSLKETQIKLKEIDSKLERLEKDFKSLLEKRESITKDLFAELKLLLSSD